MATSHFPLWISPLITGTSGDGGGMVAALALTAVARGGKRGGGV